MQNFIGNDGKFGKISEKHKRIPRGRQFRGIFLNQKVNIRSAEQYGTMAVTTSSEENISYRTNWIKQHWGSSLLDFWDDFSEDGMLEERLPTGEYISNGLTGDKA